MVTATTVVSGIRPKIRKKSSVCKGRSMNTRALPPRAQRIILRIPQGSQPRR